MFSLNTNHREFPRDGVSQGPEKGLEQNPISCASFSGRILLGRWDPKKASSLKWEMLKAVQSQRIHLGKSKFSVLHGDYRGRCGGGWGKVKSTDSPSSLVLARSLTQAHSPSNPT